MKENFIEKDVFLKKIGITEKRFKVTSPDSLVAALKRIDEIKDNENYRIFLKIKVTDSFSEDFIISEGYNNITIDIATYHSIGNVYRIESGSVEVQEYYSHGSKYDSDNYYFFKDCKFFGTFLNSRIQVEGNAIGSKIQGKNTEIILRDKSSLTFRDMSGSSVEIFSQAKFYGYTTYLCVYDNTTAYVYGSTQVRIYSDNATIYAFEAATLKRDRCTGDDYKGSIVLYDRSAIYAYKDISNLICYDNSIVYALYNYQGNNSHYKTYKNQNQECCYKVVAKKSDGTYHAIYNSRCIYKIGDIIKPDKFDGNPYIDCGHGIHLSTLRYAIDFGILSDWENLAILELTPTSDAEIVIPYESREKIRVSEAKVLREVPWEELGEFKAIAKSEPFIYGKEFV